jgi:hypothetical protein
MTAARRWSVRTVVIIAAQKQAKTIAISLAALEFSMTWLTLHGGRLDNLRQARPCLKVPGDLGGMDMDAEVAVSEKVMAGAVVG